ncbi:hypothetical protein [Salinispora sp. H7-4]|uniref:hypothetical protein n=1 Tax=Salinispora sp. H7-4 TaxID=2748321 RepID=UPI0015D42C7A|nr:hypothetical protein [Salinispora sp. H7-4]NYT94793.1 hypothetical protein [Salinispora sp. H7-4]
MPEPTNAEPDGPTPTRRFPADGSAPPPAPAGSGSAAVPLPRRQSREESIKPAAAAGRPEAPEDQTPVDPWAGTDTTGWDLLSIELPPSPPTPSSPPTQPTQPAPPTPSAPPTRFPSPAAPAPTGAPASSDHSYPAPRPAGSASPPAPGQPTSKPTGAAPSRKRRKWPWALLFVIACCCGGPAYWVTPVLNQFPAHAALPTAFGDLHLREDHHSTQIAAELARQVDEAHWTASDTFAGIYRTGAGKQVTVFGSTGLWLAPKSAAEAEMERLTGQYSLDPSQAVGTGVRGRHGRCAPGHDDGTGVVVCTSVDHSSIATAVFTRLSVPDSATLLDALRKQIVVQSN